MCICIVRARARVLKFLMITGNENVCIINIYICIYKVLLSVKPVARLTMKPVFPIQQANTSKSKKDRMDLEYSIYLISSYEKE